MKVNLPFGLYRFVNNSREELPPIGCAARKALRLSSTGETRGCAIGEAAIEEDDVVDLEAGGVDGDAGGEVGADELFGKDDRRLS